MAVAKGNGLFLDLDGTLAASDVALRQTYLAFLKQFGKEGSEAEFQSLNGVPMQRIVGTLQQTHRIAGDSARLLQLYSDMVREAHASSPPADNAQALLDLALARGWAVAVVTSAPRLIANEWLERNRLLDLIDAVVGGDDVEHGKPAPDPYRLALERTRSTAANSIAVEDSLKGALAALSAGIPTWVIAGHKDRIGWPNGVAFIDGLADVIPKL